jgi:hypothetical protein
VRRMEAVTEALWGTRMSPSTVSEAGLFSRIEPEKKRKFSLADVQACLSATSRGRAPWYVVRPTTKRTPRLIVSKTILQTLDGPHLRYPEVSERRLKNCKRSAGELELTC